MMRDSCEVISAEDLKSRIDQVNVDNVEWRQLEWEGELVIEHDRQPKSREAWVEV